MRVDAFVMRPLKSVFNYLFVAHGQNRLLDVEWRKLGVLHMADRELLHVPSHVVIRAHEGSPGVPAIHAAVGRLLVLEWVKKFGNFLGVFSFMIAWLYFSFICPLSCYQFRGIWKLKLFSNVFWTLTKTLAHSSAPAQGPEVLPRCWGARLPWLVLRLQILDFCLVHPIEILLWASRYISFVEVFRWHLSFV